MIYDLIIHTLISNDLCQQKKILWSSLDIVWACCHQNIWALIQYKDDILLV